MIHKSFNIIVATIIVCAYLVLPLTCFVHPCEFHVNQPTDSSLLLFSENGPICPALDTDECDTSCCCAEHAPAMQRIGYAPEIFSQLINEKNPKLPMIATSIFIPPKNCI